MGSFKISLKKIIQVIRYSIKFYINNSLHNAIYLSNYKKNSISKKIKFRFLGDDFTSPLVNQTLSAIKAIDENKSLINSSYVELGSPSEIFDIGANIGYWSYSYLKLNSNKIEKLHCFEPYSISYNYLKSNLAEAKNAYLYNFGLSNEDTEDVISLPEWELNRPNNLGLYSVYSKSNINAETINLKKFDDIFTPQLNVNYLFKIDVEGMESKVIEGASRFLSSSNKISILIELNKKIDQHTNNNIENTLQLLNRLNFCGYLFTNQSLKKINFEDISYKVDNNLNYDFIFKNF